MRNPGDSEAWGNFVEIYGPLVYNYGRRHGLQDADAADLTQDVFRSVARAIGDFRYDPRRGSFRSWLFTVARTKRLNLEAQKCRHAQPGSDSKINDGLNQLPANESGGPDEDEWNKDFRRRLFDWAAPQVRREVTEVTWQAFWRTAIEGATPQTVAKDLGMNVGAVYAAKCRVVARLRVLIRQTSWDDFEA
jgi:RNA polymerase sigma-70 factor (ECF subfamily)